MGSGQRRVGEKGDGFRITHQAIPPDGLTLVVGFQQSRRYDGEAISSGWETLVAGGEAEEEQAFARPGLATRDHPMSSSP